MPTLQNLRQRKFRYIKDFAQAYGCSPSKASGILKGLYHMVLSKDEVEYLASILGVSFAECADACDATYAEYKRYKGDAWKRTTRTHKGIWARWQWEEEVRRDTRKAYESGDWAEYRRKYTYTSSNDNTRSQGYTTSTAYETCFTILGVASTASPMQIKTAFRNKVKMMADGKGSYNGDMDKLVTAKEQALAHAEKAGVR